MKQSTIKILYIITLLSVSSQIMALQKSIGIGAGITKFSNHFKTNGNIMGKLQLQSYNGISADFNAGYLKAQSNTSAPDIQMIPLLVGITYTYKNPFSTFEPYIGLLFGGSVMNKSFNSPLLSYGGRAGFDIKMDHSISLFLEAQYLTLDDSKTNLTINPLNLAMGIKIKIGQDRQSPRVGKQASRRNLKRRQNQRYQRR